ncbi:hypothetical protein MTBBW1_590004 [Desulfamplus magnetovallimortis]|uniref:Uncharacterized protein n=1 Tax=Desulfamplus magnetovallimortis TaxID=1246637 RepID=A0A1W1HI00_9BACT|nr:hypothetical protein MTBBW1_590004 [Desulfamplus magnetovallimortis]
MQDCHCLNFTPSPSSGHLACQQFSKQTQNAFEKAYPNAFVFDVDIKHMLCLIINYELL